MDVVQESFLKTYKSLDKFDHNKVLYPWMKRIACSKAIDLVKKRNLQWVLIKCIAWLLNRIKQNKG